MQGLPANVAISEHNCLGWLALTDPPEGSPWTLPEACGIHLQTFFWKVALFP